MKRIIYLSIIAVLQFGFLVNKVSAQDDNKIYNFVSMENPPKYPGGVAKFYRFLRDHIKYPAEAKAKNIEGNVHISFIVEKDGKLSEIKVMRSLGAGTDEEATRVLKLSGTWNPGRVNGNPVRVQYNIPVRFSL